MTVEADYDSSYSRIPYSDAPIAISRDDVSRWMVEFLLVSFTQQRRYPDQLCYAQ